MGQLHQSYRDATEDGYKPTTEDGKPLHYPLTNQEWLQVCQELKPAELMVLYHLRTLTPFGDRLLNLGVREIARTLNMNPGTVSRALKRLDQLEYIDLELVQVNITILSKGALFENNSVVCTQHVLPVDNTDDRYTTPVVCRQHLNDDSDLKPAQSKGSRNGHRTNNKNKKDLLKQQNRPTSHPVQENKQEGIGSLLEAIEAAGIRSNPTIQTVIQQTIKQFGTSAAFHRVSAALEAVKEQINVGNAANPGGLLVKAIRGGYTPNQPPQKSSSSRPTSPPNQVEVSQAIDLALMHHDRAFAIGKLQRLWLEGWQDLVKELCHLRRDWGFRVGEQGPVES